MALLRFDAIGTTWSIEWPDQMGSGDAQVLERVRARIDTFDHTYSRFRSDSLVSEMARAAGTYVLPEDAPPMLDLYAALYEATSGRLTPLIGQALSDAGYDAAYSFISRPLSATPVWEEALAHQGNELTLRQPALLDFGAAGKGYLVDLVAAVLEQEGITEYVVDAGGDLRVRAPAPVPVALENPLDPTTAIGVASLAVGSLCGSSGNRRAWGAYHHTLDPHTGASPTHLLASWVVAETALVADAMATALSFAPARELQRVAPFAYLLLMPDYSIERSSDFPAELFITN